MPIVLGRSIPYKSGNSRQSSQVLGRRKAPRFLGQVRLRRTVNAF